MATSDLKSLIYRDSNPRTVEVGLGLGLQDVAGIMPPGSALALSMFASVIWN